EVIKKLQELDLRISGKILLAAAVLLKIKSNHLIDFDLCNLDRLINQGEEMMEEELYEDLLSNKTRTKEKFPLIPKNPQPRSRKVSVYDLVQALQEALNSRKKLLVRSQPTKFEMPKRKADIMGIIREMYFRISYYNDKEKDKELTFTRLLPPQAGKKERVYTFIPLLHLENELKIETKQEKPFDEIYVKLLNKKNKDSEEN
ncbi:hypothetical protein HYU21_00670, partial [Candidatus Woesearchaeota archaeon]|nr:hypothetical protein [Candidatus Woesearchaeota archaeon]